LIGQYRITKIIFYWIIDGLPSNLILLREIAKNSVNKHNFKTVTKYRDN